MIPDQYIPDLKALITILPTKEQIKEQHFWKKHKPR